ncbi:MAG: isoprenyl transferase [Chlorobiaceae bacterium]|jgi:undecaprenyl diphosphate synthase
MALIKIADFSSTLKAHWFSPDTDVADKQVQFELKSSCDLPCHIAIIMDGNGRWARLKGKTRIDGHAAGVESVRDVVESCSQLGVKYLTLFTFSTENWKRPEKEISALMQLLVKVIGRESRKLHDNNIRLNVIGEMDLLPKEVSAVLKKTMELTKNNNKLVLTIALSYSGQWDIMQACKAIAFDVKAGLINPEAVDEQLLASYLATASIPDPELLIRTSGEFRISNFLLWQSAYSEIYFTNTYWPDFRRSQLYDAIREFQSRERRFGQTSEQIQTKNFPFNKL